MSESKIKKGDPRYYDIEIYWNDKNNEFNAIYTDIANVIFRGKTRQQALENAEKYYKE